MFKFRTTSGTEYEIDPFESTVKRLGGEEMRQDGEVVRYFSMDPANPVMGQPVTFILPNLSGNPGVTIRATTPVVAFEEIN